MATKESAEKLLRAFAKYRNLKFKFKKVDGVKHSEVGFLHVLDRHLLIKESALKKGGVRASEVSKFMMISKPTTTQMVNSLEEKGYITRVMDKNDRRAVRINITDKGRKIVEKSEDEFNKLLYGLADYLGDEKNNELAGLVEEMFIYFDECSKLSWKEKE